MATDEDDQGFGIQRKRKREVPRSYRCGGHTTEMATSDASSTSTQWSNNEDRRQSWPSGAGSCTHGQPRQTKQMRSVIPPNNWKFTP
ncbi:hypothetical protein M8C21_015261 [Ambrosia artemisiifolia]|uniref:Uncharacterized protein n=1 Tax=Ambrosia artemisiifolia TaxID=4212 RepID=A0AAD5BMN7_AMBAR|nr:hypothetical protein M8C21_015261 [Ambrosia artemisiifolia]